VDWRRKDRLAMAGMLAFAMLPLALGAVGPARILIVTSSTAEAYGEALEGLRDGLGEYRSVIEYVDLSVASANQDLQEKLSGSLPYVVVPIGSRALAAIRPETRTVVSTMVFHADQEIERAGQQRRRGLAGSVTLDLPLSSLLSSLKLVFPGKVRVGIIRNPRRSGTSIPALQRSAREAGYALQIRDCDRADQLLSVLLSFQDQVDFIWCPPDSYLFTSSTIKSIILASVRNHLPIIGFSENFVRAGAAVGIYPDYRDIGRQTSEVVRRLLEGRSVPSVEAPRLVRIAVNEHVLRTLGLRYSQPPNASVPFLVVR
jgi:putative ABC transport system substrate-binding protein